MSKHDYCHTPKGFNLSEFETLDPLCERVPDWMKYLEGQQFSGYLRELVDDEDLSAGEYLQALREAAGDAAERLDQAHIEALRPVVPERDKALEDALSWVYQSGYTFASHRLDDYCNARGLVWSSDPMYNYVTFKVQS